MNRLNSVILVAGETKSLRLVIRTSDRVSEIASAKVVLSVRKSRETPTILAKEVFGLREAEPKKAEITITLESHETDIEAGTYQYDVWMVFAMDLPEPSIRVPLVQNAPLIVRDRVTEW